MKVYFSGNFSNHKRFERPGQEWGCDAYSNWAEQLWYIPAVYLCSKGLVADVCRMIPWEALKAYRDKWAVYEGQEDLPEELYRQADAETPFDAIDYRPEVTVNGRAMEFKRGAGLYYDPYNTQESASMEEVRRVIAHYGLDAVQGWEIRRWVFPWKTRRRPKNITSMSLKFIARERPHQAVSFHAEPGKAVQFVHPVSGVPCTLTVQALEPAQLPLKNFPHADTWEWPRCCVRMRYTLTPAPSAGWVQVNDLAASDHPVQKKQAADSSHPGAGAGAVIGGNDGPTAVFVNGRSDGAGCTAFSATHFAPVPPQDVAWQVVYYQKDAADETVLLM